MASFLTANASLASASRYWATGNSETGNNVAENRHTMTAAELGILTALALVAAAATSAGNLGIPLPGHAILRASLPMLLGISLVPRRSSGTIMSAVAAVVFAGLKLAGLGPVNVASMTGLVCLGPALDVALSQARPGWQLYGRAAAAGLVANLLAFAARMGGALFLGEAAMGRGFMSFWPLALVSFAVFGALAGLISGGMWFRGTPTGQQDVGR